MKKLFIALSSVCALMLASCAGGSDNSKNDAEKKAPFVGQWVIPVDSVNVTGFELKADGTAWPINTIYQFRSWNLISDTLLLTVQTVSPTDSTQMVESSTPWVVKSIGSDSLVITMDGVNNLVYHRK